MKSLDHFWSPQMIFLRCLLNMLFQNECFCRLLPGCQGKSHVYCHYGSLNYSLVSDTFCKCTKTVWQGMPLVCPSVRSLTAVSIDQQWPAVMENSWGPGREWPLARGQLGQAQIFWLIFSTQNSQRRGYKRIMLLQLNGKKKDVPVRIIAQIESLQTLCSTGQFLSQILLQNIPPSGHDSAPHS